MGKPVGPWDMRNVRKRCDGCRQSHLKCDGQSPCGRCVAAVQSCSRSSTEKCIILVRGTKDIRYPKQTQIAVPASAPPDEIGNYITHLFASFLRQHCFTGHVHNEHHELRNLVHCSPALQNAGSALGALDLGIKDGSLKSRRIAALHYYQEAVISLQKEIVKVQSSVGRHDAHVWTTVLLGIFELMLDPSGNAFLRHWTYGTAQMIRRQGPWPGCAMSDRQLYLTVRMFELTRALIFWTDTFLVEPQWQTSMSWFPKTAETLGWHPINALFDIMVRIIDWNHKTEYVVLRLLASQTKPYIALLRCAAEEGITLQQRLYDWDAAASDWSAVGPSTEPKAPSIDAQMILARVLSHTMCICLSNLYRHPHYDYLELVVPRLSEDVRGDHAVEIIELVKMALRQTSLAAVLLCHPLQVAGLHLRSRSEVGQVIELLREVDRRGFVVARSFEATVAHRWRGTS